MNNTKKLILFITVLTSILLPQNISAYGRYYGGWGYGGWGLGFGLGWGYPYYSYYGYPYLGYSYSQREARRARHAARRARDAERRARERLRRAREAEERARKAEIEYTYKLQSIKNR